LWKFYKQLIELRSQHSALRQLSKQHTEATAFLQQNVLMVRRWSESEEMVIAFNFGKSGNSSWPSVPPGSWRVELDSAGECWRGPGSRLGTVWESEAESALTLSPESFAVLSCLK
jgi:maltooligosyltrehalose trehalohydrolase